jgi:pentatricopeptide repeat protein
MEQAGIAAHTAHFNLVVRACTAAQRTAQALDWVRRMRRRGLRPDLVTFGALLPACRTRFQLAHTAAILRELWAADYMPSTEVRCGGSVLLFFPL